MARQDVLTYLPFVYLVIALMAGYLDLFADVWHQRVLAALVLLLFSLATFAITYRRQVLSALNKKILRISSNLTPIPFEILLVITIAATIVYFFVQTYGGPILQVDYSSFQYREHILKNAFPRFISYDPFFNAGQIDYTLVATGSINMFILTLPLMLLLPVEVAHKVQPPLIIALTPLTFYFSMLLLKRSKSEAIIAAFISLAASTGGYFSYGAFLSYGLLPYILSSLSAIVAFAACFRFFVLQDYRKRYAFILILAITLGLLHLTFVVIAIPLLIMPLMALKNKQLDRKLLIYITSICVLLVATNIRWITDFSTIFDLSLIFQSKLRDLLALLGSDIDAGAKLYQLFGPINARLKINLVVLIFGIYGTVKLLLSGPGDNEASRLGKLMALSISYLGFITFCGSFFIAGTQNGRFLIPLAFFLVISAAVGIKRLLEMVFLSVADPMPRLSLCNKLIVISYTAAVAYYIFSLATYIHVAPSETISLLKWIRANTEEGRIYSEDFGEPSRGFFITKNGEPFRGNFSAAFGGSFALAQVLTGRNFVTEPYNTEGKRAFNPNRLTDFKSDAEIHRYFELYNVKYVIAFSDQLIGFLTETGCCKKIAEIGKFAIYETDITPTYFLEGRGTVTQWFNRLEVIAEPAEEIILKYRFVKGLYVEPPLELEKFRTFTNEDFIKIKTRGARSFIIKYH